jgi:tetratricopeptide (TPR) repeat protein
MESYRCRGVRLPYPAIAPVVPLPWKTVKDRGSDGFFIVKARHVLRPGHWEECLLDLSMPERISDHAYFEDGPSLHRMYTYEAEGDVIPAVAIEAFGRYDQFYSRQDPEVGLEVLRSALPIAARKAPIAEDLGYILRDEGRLSEALSAFSLAISEGASSYFILLERADLYEAVGEHENALIDRNATSVLMKSANGYP